MNQIIKIYKESKRKLDSEVLAIPYAGKHLKATILEVLEALEGELEVYFGHILNDGVTGKPMNISSEEISKDILDFITLTKQEIL